MSALRVSRPGCETVLIDLGPASARVHGGAFGTRGSTISGALVTGSSDRTKANAAQREYMARMREMFPATTPKRQAQMAAYRMARELEGDPRPNMPRCGVMLPTVKEPCARFAGHRHEHRSRFALDNALSMKTGRGL